MIRDLIENIVWLQSDYQTIENSTDKTEILAKVPAN